MKLLEPKASIMDSEARRSETKVPAVLAAAVEIAFAGFILLALATHSSHWRTGPFTWLPVLDLPPIIQAVARAAPRAADQAPMRIGALTLLPLAWGLSWLALRMHGTAKQPSPVARGRRRHWRWGRRCFTLPFLGITTLSLLGLLAYFILPQRTADGPALSPGLESIAFQLLAMAVAWIVYLYVVNERPRIIAPLAIVILVQGAVAIGQFVHQQDLGLAWLGEEALDPAVRGVSVLYAQGTRWLRAYGLTGHPNLLAALLAPLVLLLLPAAKRARDGWPRVALSYTVVVGIGALLVTVSRGAWLAFLLGLVVWVFAETSASSLPVPCSSNEQASLKLVTARASKAWPFMLALCGALILFALVHYRDLVLSRFLFLDTAIEARSLTERWRDTGIAWKLIQEHPLTGVGPGAYFLSARAIDPSARVVHNVPLLVTAELGLLGGLFWLWLAVGPLLCRIHSWTRSSRLPRVRLCLPVHAGAWVAFVVMGLFHNVPWITTSLRTAILFGVLAGVVSTDKDILEGDATSSEQDDLSYAPGSRVRAKRYTAFEIGNGTGQFDAADGEASL